MPQIIGHDHHVKNFKRLADEGRLSHGYLFWGCSMMGKRLVAGLLAHHLEKKSFSADSEKILNDCLFVMPQDGEDSIGIDAIRAAQYFLSQKPNVSPRRTVIVDDAHMLTPEAQDALLKIAENPPSSTLLILIVKDPEMIKPTVTSRLQKIYFQAVRAGAIREWLEEVHGVPSRDADRLARESFGAPGRAFRILYDKEYKKTHDAAAHFIRAARGETREYIKELVDDEAFRLEAFLDALIVVAYRGVPAHLPFLHRAFSLRQQAAFFNLNPRLQLQALATALSPSHGRVS